MVPLLIRIRVESRIAPGIRPSIREFRKQRRALQYAEAEMLKGRDVRIFWLRAPALAVTEARMSSRSPWPARTGVRAAHACSGSADDNKSAACAM